MLDPATASFLIVSAAGLGIFGAGFYLLGPVMRGMIRREVAREEAAPVPAEWSALLSAHVPMVDRLPADKRRLLLARTRELITTCEWEGCAGFELTIDVQVIIAAQAALLALELPVDAYEGLRAVLVYPGTFVRKYETINRYHWYDQLPIKPVSLAGQADGGGTVVLSWDAALRGGRDPEDGANTVLHEFAHMLDYQAGLTTRVAPLGARTMDPFLPTSADPPTNRDVWHQLITDNYQRLCAQAEAGESTVLDDYATTNEQEFFAVATEVFFEKPAELKAQYPELYAGLKFFYRQDPEALHA
jgi:hypothetical protein